MNTTISLTRFGNIEALDSDQIIGESLRRYGEWAQLELEALAHFLRPGDHVYDVGANIGTHTLAFARFVGVEGRVVAFEPRPELFGLLSANIQTHNQLPQVVAEPHALGAKPTRIIIPPLPVDVRANHGGMSLQEDDVPGATSVEIRRLDDYSPARLNLIKIDVEGMELEVLAGATETIARCRPIIFIECNSAAKATPVIQFAQGRGYETWGLASAAYNPQNFRGDTGNIFAQAAELALMLIPREQIATLSASATASLAGRIKDEDDLFLFLLHKPQYPDEILAHSSLVDRLGLDYPSPRARRVEQEQTTIIEHLREEFAGQLAARDQDQAAIEQEQALQIDGLRAEIHALQSRLDEITRSLGWKLIAPLRLAGRLFKRSFF
jgi:FkbM family methyltransferase